LLLLVHCPVTRCVRLEVYGDTLYNECQHREDVGGSAPGLKLTTQSLNKPGTVGGIAPRVKTCEKIKMMHGMAK
jgi:hypothetical protein